MNPTLTHRAFDRYHAHLLRGPAKALVEFAKAPKVRRAVYRPGESRFIGDALNLWSASSIQPREGEAAHVTELMRWLFPVAEERGHVLDVLAFHVQHPGVKIRHALLIRGTQGSGKNTLFVTVLARICGPANHRVIGGDALTSRFNNELVDVQVLVADEVMHGDGWDVANRIKPLLSEDHILSEAKGEAMRHSLTPRLIAVLTNERTPLPLGDGDRRLWVPQYGGLRAGADFYPRLARSLPDEIPEFVAQLLARDVSHFDPNAPAPFTTEKAELQAAVKPPLERLFRQWLEDGFGPFAKDIVLPRTLVSEARAAGYGSANEGAVQRALQALGALSLGQLPHHPSWGGRVRCWCVRNLPEWQAAGPAAWARHLHPSASLADLTTTGAVVAPHQLACAPDQPQAFAPLVQTGELSERLNPASRAGERA